MTKPCDKTVSGEALSQKRLEEEIRKHAKTLELLGRDAKRLWDELVWYKQAPLFKKTLTKTEYKTKGKEFRADWVPLDVVLGVVAKTEAEHRESLRKIAKLFDNEELDQLYALEQENRELNNDLAGYKTAAERTKKLQQLLKEFPECGHLNHYCSWCLWKEKFEAFLIEVSSQESSQQQEQKQP